MLKLGLYLKQTKKLSLLIRPPYSRILFRNFSWIRPSHLSDKQSEVTHPQLDANQYINSILFFKEKPKEESKSDPKENSSKDKKEEAKSGEHDKDGKNEKKEKDEKEDDDEDSGDDYDHKGSILIPILNLLKI